MITDDPIRHSVLHQVLRDVAYPAATVHKPAHQSPIAIEFRHRLQLTLVQEALHQTAVEGLPRS